jgi:hypothetical protein
MKNGIIVLISGVFTLLFNPASYAAEDIRYPAPMMFDTGVVLSSLMVVTDSYIKAIACELDVASVTEEAASGDWQRIRPLLEMIQKREKGGAIAWYALPDGSYYTVDDGLTNKNLKDRAYFPKVLAGQISVGELVVSKATGQVSTIIAVPIKKGDPVTGILGVSLFTKKLSAQLKSNLGFKDDVIFFALNEAHITVINSEPDRVFLDPEAQGSSSMTKAIKEMLKKDEGTVEYDFNGKRRVVFRKSSYTNWWYAAGLQVKNKRM